MPFLLYLSFTTCAYRSSYRYASVQENFIYQELSTKLNSTDEAMHVYIIIIMMMMMMNLGQRNILEIIKLQYRLQVSCPHMSSDKRWTIMLPV